MPYLREAQDMALFYSGELRPPDSLTQQIRHELSLLREEWQDSISGVTTIFWTPWWRTGRVELRVDDTAFASIMNGQNKAWNDLCDRLNLSYRQIYSDLIDNHIDVTSSEPLHPRRMADLFAELPFVNYIGSAEKGWTPCPSIVRFDDNGTSKYFVRVFCQVETMYKYYYFIVDSATSHLIGLFSDCHPKRDSLAYSLPRDSFYILEAIQDSIQQSRPAWVDTARHHLSDLDWWNSNKQ